MASLSVHLRGFEEHISLALESLDFEKALQIIFEHASFAARKPDLKGRFIRLPRLDRSLIEISRLAPFESLAPSSQQHRSNGQYVILASEIYSAGGHGRLLNQIANNFPCHIIFTDIFGRLKAGSIDSNQFVSERVLSRTTLSADQLVDKIVQGLSILNSISPDSLILLGHHEDVVAICLGILYRKSSRTIYVHHTDYNPGLGATIRFPVHFDTTTELATLCGDFGLKSTVIPLCVEETGRRVGPPLNEKLVLATSGTWNKFEGEIGGISYADILVACIASGYVSRFVHIGDLHPKTHQEIYQKFAANGFSMDLFSPIGRVSQVSGALVDQGVNAYLSSFPLAGALSTSEAQSVGAPVIYFADIRNGLPLCHMSSIYASAQLGWSTGKDFGDILSTVLKDWERLSQSAASHYTLHNGQREFIKKIEAGFSTIRGDFALEGRL
jgi:hypothetical protein